MPIKTWLRRPLGNTQPCRTGVGWGELAENSGSPELFQKCNWSLFLAGAWAAGGRGRGGTRCPGQTLPVGVGQRGWPRLQIPLPNNAEQQSATGSGDSNHVTFAPQVSCPRRAGGAGCRPGCCRGRHWLTDGDGAVCPAWAAPALLGTIPVPAPGSHRPWAPAAGLGLAACDPEEGRQPSERGRERRSTEELLACNVSPKNP